ncbi:MAG: hypothetical protein NWT08_05895 [Akkermansiaceae bacterium]|jgi:hypothetical protein|nr:hypothetical protein [Akkermansiaceae bacterium]MDP4645783.1 hypothetical protein [Akkermansiaceae bacterium]MDP4847952.1 hypothetical protein [Akkermansiaceae bacterium]
MMALVIANPACCCAFKAHSDSTSQTSNSCCSGKTDPSKKKEDKSCTCSQAKEKTSPEKHLFTVDLTFSLITPEPISTEIPLPKLSEAADFLAKWPPGRLPIPTVGNRLAINCTYLI